MTSSVLQILQFGQSIHVLDFTVIITLKSVKRHSFQSPFIHRVSSDINDAERVKEDSSL